MWELAENVTKGLEHMKVPLRVAVMGCVVNGPGEAREADLGVASGNGKGQIFVKGEVIKTVPEDQIVETLIEEATRIAAEMEASGEYGSRGFPGCFGELVSFVRGGALVRAPPRFSWLCPVMVVAGLVLAAAGCSCMIRLLFRGLRVPVFSLIFCSLILYHSTGHVHSFFSPP